MKKFTPNFEEFLNEKEVLIWDKIGNNFTGIQEELENLLKKTDDQKWIKAIKSIIKKLDSLEDSIAKYDGQLGVIEVNEAAKVTTYAGEWADHLLDKKKEKKAAKSYAWIPKKPEPITIISANIEMVDDYTGNVEITFSNGDEIEYSAVEKFGKQGPESTMKVFVNGNDITTDDFLERYTTGVWVETLTNIYEDWYNKNKK